jgi:hypothetical protein
MKAVTMKMLVSLVGIAVAAPFFAIAVIVGARAVALAHDAQDDLLLVALALGGAAISMINGYGRRTVKAERVAQNQTGSEKGSDARGASAVNLGY